jgi:hypothetical protein
MPLIFSRLRSSDYRSKLRSRKKSSNQLLKAAAVRCKFSNDARRAEAEPATTPSSFASSGAESFHCMHYYIHSSRGEHEGLDESNNCPMHSLYSFQDVKNHSDSSYTSIGSFSFTGNITSAVQDESTLCNDFSTDINPLQTFHKKIFKRENVDDMDWGYFVDVVEDLESKELHSHLLDDSHLARFQQQKSCRNGSVTGGNIHESGRIFIEQDEATFCHGRRSDTNSHQSLSFEATLARFYGLYEE